MSQQNVEIVRVCFEGFNRGEISDLLANLSEDCVRMDSFTSEAEALEAAGLRE
jgi:ketosteroid isomerase-like protein